MSGTFIEEQKSSDPILLGNQAVALGALHAGLTAAYAYPGTPSTELLEYLIALPEGPDKPVAVWSTNEKTAYEEALGVSMVGRRALVAMKHVGLNVAADPFMNSALVTIHGGLVVVVADDPGMHSSQNEQDSRVFADFARIPCLEPSNQQEAYDMVREAFDISERFHVPVMVRIVTRLAHSRTLIHTRPAVAQRPLSKPPTPNSWTLLPALARGQWKTLLETQQDLRGLGEDADHNPLQLNAERRDLGVITAGVARNYYFENLEALGWTPSHLHVGTYPMPIEKLRALCAHVDEVLVLEDGYPYLERELRGVLPTSIRVRGRMSGDLPLDGELDPDRIRGALGLPVRTSLSLPELTPVGRPPKLCNGCPHGDAYGALKKALAIYDQSLVASDIGCYTLGALPPYSAIESCVCMGASVGMAKGAADAGLHPAVAVIGDSTFLHSGVTPLMDAVAADTNMTLLILDNETVAMTGNQPTIMDSSRLEGVIRGIGVNPEHLHVVEVHPRRMDELAELMARELAHPGLSVIVTVRECIEAAKKRKRAARSGNGGSE